MNGKAEAFPSRDEPPLARPWRHALSRAMIRPAQARALTDRRGAQADPAAALADTIRRCRVCRDVPRYGPPLPQEPRPILRVNTRARLLVASQAPGIRAHNSGLPFDDPSGDRLRFWMGVDRPTFYDERNVLIGPMGFCFPGHTLDKGDLPPRRECAEAWHDHLFALMPQVELILAIGRYAQLYHFRRLGRALPAGMKLENLVRAWRDHLGDKPRVFALPHPSWRNSGWLKKNPWFEAEVLPEVRREVAALIAGPPADIPLDPAR